MYIRRGCQIVWNQSSRQLWTAMWMLGAEPESSARAVSTFNCWAISAVLSLASLKTNQGSLKPPSTRAEASGKETAWSNGVLKGSVLWERFKQKGMQAYANYRDHPWMSEEPLLSVISVHKRKIWKWMLQAKCPLKAAMGLDAMTKPTAELNENKYSNC